jgi:hypothetical protein
MSDREILRLILSFQFSNHVKEGIFSKKKWIDLKKMKERKEGKISGL